MSFFTEHITRFRYHILLFLSSVIVITALFHFSGYNWVDVPIPSGSSDTHYIENYSQENAGRNEVLRIQNCIDKKSILLFGSSELTSREMPMIPYRFFNDSLKIPLLAIGHAGFQDFSIFLQLAGLDFNLENYPLVILLSPGWFHHKSINGTELGPFLNFAVEPYLYSIFLNENLPEEFRNYTGKYIHRHFPEISNPSGILKAFNYSYSSSLSPLHTFVFSLPEYATGLYCRKKMPPASAFRSGIISSTHPVDYSEEKWEKLSSFYTEEHSKKCTNNSWSVENSYYDAWLKNSGKKTIYPASSFRFTEMEDLEMLLRYLKFKKATPLFIIQPLNPYAYENLKDLDPVMKKITGEISRYGYPCLDLWTSDPAHYKSGTLKDVMHFGNTGWCDVNKKILDYYNQLSHEKN